LKLNFNLLILSSGDDAKKRRHAAPARNVLETLALSPFEKGIKQMLQSFIIILREGFESFLLVAVILAYLRKTGQRRLAPAVYAAILSSIAASIGLGYILMNGVEEATWQRILGVGAGTYVAQFFGNESLREAVLGVVAIVMVGTLVVHMWRTGPRLKQEMHKRLSQVSEGSSSPVALLGVFLFTFLMMTREGMETALMMLQVREGSLLTGALLGIGAAGALAWAWSRFSHLINVRRFFQVTGIFLLLFMVQVGIYSFHEFSEAGLLPNSDAIHAATEKFSPDGLYGKWFSLLLVAICALWLLGAFVTDRLKAARQDSVSLEQV
jgi:high-affinity iron transporter